MKSISYLLFLVFLAANCFAQSALDTNQIKVGEQTTYSIKLPANGNIAWPILQDTLTKDIEIIGEPILDTTADFISWKINITAFDSGFYAIPPLNYNINGSTLQTNPLLLSVYTIPVDTAAAPMPIADIYLVPFSFTEWLTDNWVYITLGLLLIIAAFLAYRYTVNKPKPVIAKKVEPKVSLIERITKILSKIEEEKVWEKGEVKLYYSQLSEAIRFYLEERYEFPALEFSSAEINDVLMLKPIDAEVKEKIKEFLFVSDMVKFAKVSPPPTEHINSLKTCFLIVEKTHIKIENNQESKTV